MNTINKFKYLLILLIVPCLASAQVGINTTTPNTDTALDVNGKMRIGDVSGAASLNRSDGLQLMVADANNNNIVVGIDASSDFTIEDNKVKLNTGRHVQSKYINLKTQGEQHNLDLGIDADEKGVVIFFLDNLHDIKITGISGGTEGRRIVLVNMTSNKKLRIYNEKANSSPQNRIRVKTSANKTKAGKGSISLVYTADENLGGGRWIAYEMEAAHNN